MFFSFFDSSIQFCFLLIEFHCTFSISFKMPPYYAYYYCILIRCDRPSGYLFFVPALLISLLKPSLLTFFLCLSISFWLFSCASVWKTLLGEYHNSCCHNEFCKIRMLINLRPADRRELHQRALGAASADGVHRRQAAGARNRHRRRAILRAGRYSH